MNNEILVHYGIKGQKWGIRRYQNADGSLTDAGRKHYNVGKARGSNNYPSEDEMQRVIKRKSLEKAYDKAVDKKDFNAYSNALNDAANRTSTTTSNMRNARNEYKKSKLPPVDTSKMTNRELQEAVTRMNLEDNYTRLTQNRELAKQGKDWVDVAIDSLDEVADVAKIAASIAAVVAVVAKLH